MMTVLCSIMSSAKAICVLVVFFNVKSLKKPSSVGLCFLCFDLNIRYDEVRMRKLTIDVLYSVSKKPKTNDILR